jgi:MFS family permease
VTDAPRRLVAVACAAVAAAYLLPASYNYVVTPMIAEFGVGESESSLLRQVPNIAALLVIFLAGVLGQRSGERRALAAGGVLLAAGSAVVAVAPGFPVAIAGLSVQAVGATVLLVVSLGLLGARIHDDHARATAFSVYSMVSPLVFLALPLLAGLLLQYASWRPVAAVWALGGAVAAVISWRGLPADRTPAPRPGDPPRTELLTPLLAGVAAVGLVQACAHADTDGLMSRATLVRLAIGLVALGLLAVAYRRIPRPSLSLAVLHRGGAVILLVVVALWCFTQLWYYMTLAYQYVFGLSVLATALAMVPAQACAAIGARAAGGLITRFGILATGTWLLVGTGVSLLLSTAISQDGPLWWPILVTSLYSLASVAAGVPMTTALMDAAPPGEDGSASAFRSAAINAGTVLGIALVSGLVFSAYATSLQQQVAAAGLPAQQTDQIADALRTGADSEEEAAVYAVPLTEVEQIDRMQKQAYLAGIDAQGYSGAAVSFLTAGAFVLARRRQVRSAAR